MLEAQTLILFAGACLVLAMIPGPDNLFVSAQSFGRGTRAGLAAASGILLGGVLWTIAATLGLTALLATQPTIFVIIQIIGVAYLIFLAVDLWGNSDVSLRTPPDVGHAFVRGLTTNLLNPKVGLYYLAFLPQFIEVDAGSIWQQMLVLGIIFNFIGAVVMYVLALAAGHAQSRVQKHGAVNNWLPRFGALILLGIAVKLLWGLIL